MTETPSASEENPQGPARESHLRSVLKAFSWRVVATTTTTTITYMITGQVGTALKVGFIEFFFKIFVYYAHERAWQMVPRGFFRKLGGRG